MSDERHTPGPWSVDDLGDESFCETNHKYGIGSPNSPCYRLAKIEGLGETALANARLIAPAPDLLAACKAAQSELKQLGQVFWSGDMERVHAKLSAAIARAEAPTPNEEK
jgi:hypothetical protein